MLFPRILHSLHNVLPLQVRLDSHFFAFELARTLKRQGPHVLMCRSIF